MDDDDEEEKDNGTTNDNQNQSLSLNPQSSNTSKNEQRLSMTKKRKSVDIIELVDSSDSNKQLEEIIEEESAKKFKPESDVDDLIEISSSPPISNSNSPTKKVAETDNIDDDDQLDANELLSLLNKTTPNVAKHKAQLSQANQSLGTNIF